MSKYYKYVDIGILPLVDMTMPTETRFNKLYSSNINPEFLKFLNERDLVIGHKELLYAKPHFEVNRAHVDGSVFDFHGPWPSRCKLNYVLGDTTATTQWYDVLAEDRDKVIVSESVIKTNFVSYNLDVCIEVEKISLSGWHLFESGTPHRINNFSDNPRWCICFGIYPKGKSLWMSFEEGCQRLSPSFNG